MRPRVRAAVHAAAARSALHGARRGALHIMLHAAVASGIVAQNPAPTAAAPLEPPADSAAVTWMGILPGVGSIPKAEPLSPMAASRTGLYVQPFVLPEAGWRPSISMSYASIIELQQVGAARYLLDAELLNVEVGATRHIGRRGWLRLSTGIAAAFDGALDGAFDGYHSAIGFTMEERAIRPTNTFGDSLTIPALGIKRARPRPGPTLADVRLTTGYRWAEAAQLALSVTLPTAPAANLASRGVPTVSLMQTFRGPLEDRMIAEASVGAGYASRGGELAAIQEELFYLGSVSARLRLYRGHSAYGTLFAHSAMYSGTRIRTFDAGEISGDFGYAYRWSDGRELRIGLMEDILRQDHGVDLALRVSFVR